MGSANGLAKLYAGGLVTRLFPHSLQPEGQLQVHSNIDTRAAHCTNLHDGYILGGLLCTHFYACYGINTQLFYSRTSRGHHGPTKPYVRRSLTCMLTTFSTAGACQDQYKLVGTVTPELAWPPGSC